jgi:hypothetical protein
MVSLYDASLRLTSVRIDDAMLLLLLLLLLRGPRCNQRDSLDNPLDTYPSSITHNAA